MGPPLAGGKKQVKNKRTPGPHGPARRGFGDSGANVRPGQACARARSPYVSTSHLHKIYMWHSAEATRRFRVCQFASP